jgi:hypothetical protein
VAPPKTAGPAIAQRDEPTLNVEQLGGPLDLSNTRNVAGPQVETDFDFFRARPHARIRNRLPFPDEFAPEHLDEGGLDCFVHAIVERNSVGQPIRRARWLLFCEGGRA